VGYAHWLSAVYAPRQQREPLEEGQERDGRHCRCGEFLSQAVASSVDKIALENPVGSFNSIRSPTQYIEPYEHGHEATKKTCLWLKGLPELQPTNVVGRGEFVVMSDGTPMTE
jgi:hypothetical protein